VISETQFASKTANVTETLAINPEIYRALFNQANIALWIEDASLLKKEIDSLRKEGVSNFRQYLNQTPAELLRFIDLIKIVDLNDHAVSLFKAKSKSQITNGIRNFFDKDTYYYVQEELLHFIDGGVSCEYESGKYTVNGDLVATHLKTIIPEECRQTWSRWFVVETDITERKKIEEQLHSQRVELDSVNSFRNNLMSSLSHDLRNQLNNILGFTNLLKERYHELGDTKRLEFIDYISQISNATGDLLYNLLNWARAKEGYLALSLSNFSFEELYTGCLKQLQTVIYTKNISINIFNPHNIQFNADFNIVSFVVRNIIQNAVKYSFPNGTIDITLRIVEHKTFILITDYGMGMTRDQLSGIFNVGSINPESASTQGAGVGLILCNEFVKLHGGSILVESKKDVGTTFTIILPVATLT